MLRNNILLFSKIYIYNYIVYYIKIIHSNISYHNIIIINNNYYYVLLMVIKDFPKERYNTYAKSCNSNLYTKYPGATYSGLLLGTMRCL